MPKGTSFIILSILLFFGCSKKEETSWTIHKSKLKRSFIATNKVLLKKLNDVEEQFSLEINLFNTVPAQYKLDDCKIAWKNYYNEYLLFSPYQSIEGQLNFGFNDFVANLDQISINYGYVDYTDNQPNGGIIKNPSNYPVINTTNVTSWHQLGGESNATLGFHVLEFLLWGEDLTAGSPGSRTNNDYLQINSENERRMDFLNSVWDQQKNNTAFLSIDPSYENMVLAMNSNEFFNTLLESSIEFIEKDFIQRSLETPLKSQSQYDEISDFSDNTMDNLETKLYSLRLLFDGSELFEVDRETWYFLIDFIEDVEPTIASNILTSLDNIKELLGSISVDFDQAIQNNVLRENLKEVIKELNVIKEGLDTVKLN